MSALSRYALVLPLLTLGAAPAAHAQSSSSSGSAGFFMPPSAQTQKAPEMAPKPKPKPLAPTADETSQPQTTKFKVPNLPALPAESPPPTAVIGVLSVPQVLQQSTAAQAVQAEIKKRQDALAKDAQAARAKIQAEQQAIMAERGKLTDAELEKKEQALQNEIAATQTKFQERNQAIQNAGQTALQQIEAMLAGIVKQEAQAHGMNLVLHREQAVLNVAAFDITDETVKELNKLLPSVKVPPSVVTPGMQINPPEDQGVGP
ncbi:OmpH family outer membrane protein [Acidocella sp.]|uniref:OmpH family outer membrane protein n=1 Tax=Acidocella sp. TaxID=50710 RepID=UPI003CFF2CC8